MDTCNCAATGILDVDSSVQLSVPQACIWKESGPSIMSELVTQSLAIIRSGQAPSGAYVACPSYCTYNYCWFRDGTFVAHAMDLWHEQPSTERFYSWACDTILARADAVGRCVQAVAQGGLPDPADLLHTRYTLAGDPGSDDWPNFQLDGFGTLLWGLRRHQEIHGAPAPSSWQDAARLLVRYLAALWPLPNYDCWEEFADRRAVSTLAAVYAGLHAAVALLGVGDPDGGLAAEAAEAVRASVLRDGVRDGHLIKQLHGDDIVDASLLWAAVPFGAHGLLAVQDPLMRATVARIERDLIGETGGVHRYRADTFYGGGEWMLLTALLGEYRAQSGDREGAELCRLYVARHAGVDGTLPEQSSAAPLAPEYLQEWLDRWGPVAQPLLWSHANYLSLCASLNAQSSV